MLPTVQATILDYLHAGHRPIKRPFNPRRKQSKAHLCMYWFKENFFFFFLFLREGGSVGGRVQEVNGFSEH